MKFYICEVTRYFEPVNGKEEVFSMNARDDEISAEILFHKKVAAAMENTNVCLELCMVKNEYGTGPDSLVKHFERHKEEPEEIVEPEQPEEPEPTEPEE